MEQDLFAVKFKEDGELSSKLIGVSSCRFKENFVVTGGLANGGGNGAALQLQLLNLTTIRWKCQAFPSFPNRYYHSSVNVHDRIYLLGGFNVINDVPYSPLLVVTESRFGLKINRIDPNIIEAEGSVNTFNKEWLSLGGSIAQRMGKDEDKIVLFGGTSQNNLTFSNEVILLIPSKTVLSQIDVKLVPIESNKPDPRAYHTAVSITPTLLLIHGGRTKNHDVFNDFWILDLGEIVNIDPNLVPVEAPPEKGKGGKSAKSKEPVQKPPSGYWFKLNTDTFPSVVLPRFQHTSIIAPSENNDGGYSLFVFGGINKEGSLSLDTITRIDLHEDATTKYSIKNVEDIQAPIVNDPINQRIISKESISSFTSSLLTIQDTFPDNNNNNGNGNGSLGIIIYGGFRQLLDQNKASSTNTFWSEKYNITYLLAMNQNLYTREWKQLRKKIQLSNQHIPELYIPDINEDNNGNGLTRIQYENGDVYLGQVIETLEEGGGEEVKKAIITDEGVRIGFETDIRHGKGKMSYANGDIYEGSWDDNLRQGPGRMTYSDNNLKVDGKAITTLLTYEGSFFEDKKHGKGKLSDEGGIFIYQGVFQNDVFQGTGELKLESSDVYNGLFENNLRHGRGEIKNDVTGYRIVGNWVNDVYQDGEVENYPIISFNPVNRLTIKGYYSGTMHDGKPSGVQGNCLYEDGSRYTGDWKSGKKNGYGEYSFSSGDRYDGKWVGDKRCGYGKLFSKINPEYEGQWDDDRPHGHGVMFYHDRTYFIGEFVKGLKEGVGQLFRYDQRGSGEGGGSGGGFTATLHPGNTVSLEEAKDLIVQQGLWLNDHFVR